MVAVDYASLLLAIGFAGTCLSVTLLVTWFSSRSETFMLTWVWGAALIVGSVFVYVFYFRTFAMIFAATAMTMLLSGLALIVGAATHFRTGRFPVAAVTTLVGVSALLVVPPFVMGLDGIAFMAANFWAGGLLIATAVAYWRGRHEAPIAILSLTVLYALIGVSFLLCGAVLVADGSAVLTAPPDNWAEDLNLLLSIGGVCGIGAVSLALHQTRLARSHQIDARTDMHTGLLNRRALFDAYGDAPLAAGTAVIVFDLDDFKSINDRYGHAAGDAVLARFADVLRSEIRSKDVAARLGGEEFAVVMPEATPMRASMVAERVRSVFGARPVETDRGRIACTVSAGVAFALSERQPLDRVISRADSALYVAKRGGRNRVESDSYRRAG